MIIAIPVSEYFLELNFVTKLCFIACMNHVVYFPCGQKLQEEFGIQLEVVNKGQLTSSLIVECQNLTKFISSFSPSSGVHSAQLHHSGGGWLSHSPGD